MISKHVFDTLEYVFRKIRGNNLQFGGIQVIGSNPKETGYQDCNQLERKTNRCIHRKYLRHSTTAINE
jgi:hypothetical protein